MSNESVRRVQELRRSNAAQPRPGKRQDGPSAEDWAPGDCDCPCHEGPDHCAVCSNDYSDLRGKDDLWDADPNCDHEIVELWSGIKCKHCRGWHCA